MLCSENKEEDMRKIGEMNMPHIGGIFLIYDADGEYRIYFKYRTYIQVERYGEISPYPKDHKKLVSKYTDYREVMYHLKALAYKEEYYINHLRQIVKGA